MNKYQVTYFLNTACAERRPQTARDVEEDWVVVDKYCFSDLDAFEFAYINILDFDRTDLIDEYKDLPDENDLTRINRLKELFDDNNSDPGCGRTLLISIKGPGETYTSDYDKSDFLPEEESDDYDDDEYLN